MMHCNSERLYEPAGILSSTTFMFPQTLDPSLNSPELTAYSNRPLNGSIQSMLITNKIDVFDPPPPMSHFPFSS